MDAYRFEIEDRQGYLHATATGPRTPQNALRFLREAYAACVDREVQNLLLEMNLAGPSLGTYDVYRVITERSPDGVKLGRIAYVDDVADDPRQVRFAETFAVNRGMNVRLFNDVLEAARWLEESPGS